MASPKKERRQNIPHFCITKLRIIILNFIKNGLLHMENRMFLVIISDFYIRSKPELSRICRFQIV